MTKEVMCSQCREELGREPVYQGDKVYCCQACAFEAGRSADCSGRADGHISPPEKELSTTEKS